MYEVQKSNTTLGWFKENSFEKKFASLLLHILYNLIMLYPLKENVLCAVSLPLSKVIFVDWSDDLQRVTHVL